MTDQTSATESAAQRRWPGFWPWLITTLLLLALIAALAWHLHTREAQVVEVTGPTPPPADPAPELVAEAARLRQQITERQGQLDLAIQALDPPRCVPPMIPDPDKLAEIRKNEADNLRRWRALLVPVEPVLPPPASTSTTPATTAPADPAPLRRQSAVPASQTITGPVERLPVEQVRQRLEKSTVIVVGLPPEGQKGLFTGTGFFISPTHFVTNRHVIEKADPGSIYVTSRALGTVHKARLLAATGTSDIGKRDFAVLSLTEGQGPGHVSFGPEAAKLVPVVAAGFPSLSLKTDTGFRALLKGDLSAAPDLNMNRGEVRSVQPRGEITQIVHTADVLQGYSGGPLMDGCGRVIGQNTFIQVDRKQAGKLNSAIAVADLAQFLTANGVAVTIDNRACPAE